MELREAEPLSDEEGPRELVALECDGCTVHVPLTKMRGVDPLTRQRVRSSHAGQLHDACTAKGTWRGRWQLSLLLGPTTRDPREGQQ
jgi:hypothetical protein